MAVPKLEKIVINRGLGEATTNQKVIELTVNQMVAITGQIPVLCRSKKRYLTLKSEKIKSSVVKLRYGVKKCMTFLHDLSTSLCLK